MALAIPAPHIPKILLDLTNEGSIEKKLQTFTLPSNSQQYVYLNNILTALNNRPQLHKQTMPSPFANTEDLAYHQAVLAHNLPDSLTTGNWYQILGSETQHFRVGPQHQAPYHQAGLQISADSHPSSPPLASLLLSCSYHQPPLPLSQPRTSHPSYHISPSISCLDHSSCQQGNALCQYFHLLVCLHLRSHQDHWLAH